MDLHNRILSRLIQANNVSMPGEPIETQDGKQLTTRILSTLTTIADIQGVIIGANPLTGDNVTIGDVADVALARGGLRYNNACQ